MMDSVLFHKHERETTVISLSISDRVMMTRVQECFLPGLSLSTLLERKQSNYNVKCERITDGTPSA